LDAARDADTPGKHASRSAELAASLPETATGMTGSKAVRRRFAFLLATDKASGIMGLCVCWRHILQKTPRYLKQKALFLSLSLSLVL
jgi:hypothetical protein